MTKDDLIRMADLVGYDVDDDDDVYAPASGRYGLDPRLEHFAQLVADLVRQDEREQCAADYLEDCARAVEAARLEEREACAKLCDEFAKFFGKKGEYATHELHRREWETLVGCAKSIRGRTE